MKTIVLKSSHGNQLGYNVKWQLLDSFDTVREAKEMLLREARSIENNNENYRLHENGRVWDIENSCYLYTTNEDSFEEDLYKYTILRKKDAYEFFDGKCNGYMPQFVKDEFGLEED